MKKRDLITMFLCVPGAGLFALGMCMCLLPEWGAAVQGVWTGAAGIAVLLWAWVLHRIMSGKPAVRHFVPFPVSWTVKMKKKQKETQDILSYHTQAAGCSDKARAKASGGRQPIEECGRTGL